jgi:presenilin-like A22 family membrane protease
MEFRDVIPLMGMPLMLLLVQIGAILISPTVQEAGYTAFEDPSSVANPLIFIAILLAFTLFLLILIKKGGKKIIALIIAASIFLTFLYIFSAISGHFLGASLAGSGVTVILSLGATALLYFYPEWYVIDLLGILISAGAASIFGISLEITPVLILLVILAVYDAISVYKTRHMITLAEGVIDTKSPILVVIPKRRDYSYRKEGLAIGDGERGAFVMGLGDLIMPTILVVSAHVFLAAPAVLGFTSVPALGAMIGSLAGLGVLLYFVSKGNPQAGLPTLNGGAILGFLVACTLTGNWSWLFGM